MLRKFRERMESEKGFTLIELLVVILIIGILAAIALPAFLGQQKKGQDSSAKSNARNMVSHVESCFADTETYVSCDSAAELGTTGLSYGTTAGKVSVLNPATATTYTVSAVSKNNDHWFRITHNVDGTTTRTCSDAGDGGCKAADADGNMW